MPEADVLGAVLAGGRGSRLGGAKASVLFGGRPLAGYPAAALRGAGVEEVVVVAKPGTPLPELGLRPVWEPEGVHHPLAGIIAALDAAAGRPVLAVAADMPFLSPALLATIARSGDRARAVAPRVAGKLEPLCARYPTQARAPLAEALAQRAPLRAALEALRPLEILDADPAELFNVNTAAELAAAEQRLHGGS